MYFSWYLTRRDKYQSLLRSIFRGVFENSYASTLTSTRDNVINDKVCGNHNTCALLIITKVATYKQSFASILYDKQCTDSVIINFLTKYLINYEMRYILELPLFENILEGFNNSAFVTLCELILLLEEESGRYSLLRERCTAAVLVSRKVFFSVLMSFLINNYQCTYLFFCGNLHSVV